MADDKMKTRVEISLQQFTGQEVTPKLIDDVRKTMQRIVDDIVTKIAVKDNVEILVDPERCDALIVRVGASRRPSLTRLNFERQALTAQQVEDLGSGPRAAYELERRLADLGYGEDIELMYPTGYASCVIGVAESGFSLAQPALVISKTKVLETLVKDDGMTEDEALEFFEFNISGAYVGHGTPIFVETI